MEPLPDASREILETGLLRTRERVWRALERAGRPSDATLLVAVTKSVSLPVIRTLVELGQQHLGENRPEVLRARAREISTESVRWHLIGRLQSRKVRDAIEPVDLIHSIDDLPLLARVHTRALDLGRAQRVLLQVNVSKEGTKQGFSSDRIGDALHHAMTLGGVRVEGLMTMAPFGDSEAGVRGVFSRLRELRDRLATQELPLKELSMGMSGDFEAAVLEGATLVRIGTALFEGLGPETRAFKAPGR